MKEALCAACSWPQERRAKEGWVENLLFPFCVLFQNQNLKTEQFPFPPDLKRARMEVKEAQPRHPPPPPHLLSPVGSRVLRDALPSESGPRALLRCPTAVTSVVPLVLLVQSSGAWLALPWPSHWLLRTIRLGYAIQFAPRPPKFRGIRFTSVLNKDAPVSHAKIVVLLAKDAIEPVPPAEMKSGFYSPYFIVPKKGDGLRPILDLHVLNWALHKLPFRMLMQKCIFQCIRPFNWFAAIDLKDAYFHVLILPRHRPFLHFAFERQAYQYKVLPFWLWTLCPRVFTKVMEAALVPLMERGIRILNYLDDWLILAQSRAQLCEHRETVLSHLSRWRWRIYFLGMKLDSVNLTAHLSIERVQSMLNCLESFQGKRAVPLKQFQSLLGHMASATAVTPLGLLHMRPLQYWLHDQVPRRVPHTQSPRPAIRPSARGRILLFLGHEYR